MGTLITRRLMTERDTVQLPPEIVEPHFHYLCYIPCVRLQALVYNILPPITAITGYAIGPEIFR